MKSYTALRLIKSRHLLVYLSCAMLARSYGSREWSFINGKLFICVPRGCVVIDRNGDRRLILNSWYRTYKDL